MANYNPSTFPGGALLADGVNFENDLSPFWDASGSNANRSVTLTAAEGIRLHRASRILKYETHFVEGWGHFSENAFGASSGMADGLPGRPGIVFVKDGTTGGQAVRRWLASTSSGDWRQFTFSGGVLDFEVGQNVITASGLDKYRVGFMDDEIYNTPSDGVWLEMDGSRDLYLKTANNGSVTTSSALATLSTATWYRIGFRVNSAGNSVQVYINGSATGSPNTTNIPTSRVTGLGVGIRKGSDSTESEVRLDYLSTIQFLAP